MKKAVSILTAAALAASMAVSVSALDYGKKPDYKLPPNTKYGNNSIQVDKAEPKLPPVGTSLENPETVIDKNVINNAIENDSSIYASYEEAVLKANALAALARTRLSKVTIITKRYTAEIDSESITEAKDISIAAKMSKSTKRRALIFDTEHEGSFGCTVNFIIGSKYYSQCDVDLNNAHVYYVIEEENLVIDMGSITLNSTGNIVLSLTQGGKYIIM